MRKSLLLISLLFVSSASFSAEVEKELNESQEIGSLVEIVDLNSNLSNLICKSYPASIRAQVESFVSEKFKEQSFRDKVIKVYNNHLTSEEIADLIRFYKTKTGAKFFKKNLLIMEDLSKFIQEIIPGLVDEIASSFKDRLDELSFAGVALGDESSEDEGNEGNEQSL